MEQKTKHILWITGASILVVGATIGLIVYFRNRNADKEDEGGELGVDNPYLKSKPPKASSGTSSSSGSSSNTVKPSSGTPNSGTSTSASSPKKITARFNEEKELINPLSEIKGKLLYPKRATMGGQGYTNLRTSASVNTESAWYDPFDNLITTIRQGIPIGRVLSETTSLLNSYPYRWFKVKLYKKFNSYEYAFVRADTVTFAPYFK